MRALIAEKRRRHSRIKIVINTVLTKLNASDVPAIIDLANSLGVDGFKLSHLNLVGNAVAVSDRLALTAVDEFAVAEAVMRIIPNYPSITFDILSSKPKFLEYLYKAYSVSFPVTVSGCKACIREIYVDPTGHIAPCLSTYEGFSDIAQVDGTIKDYRINLLDLQHIPISDYPFYEEFRHAFPLTKDTYQHYVPCNTCPYLTTLCYPCPLGVAGRVHVEELCAIAEEKLQCFDRREN